MEINGSKLWDRIYLLTLLFIGLKLADEIGWSWWWVFSPILITLGIGAFFLLLGAVIAAKIRKTPAWTKAMRDAKLRARVIKEEDSL